MNDVVRMGDYVVRRGPIIGTRTIVYSAWEPTEIMATTYTPEHPGHATVTHDEATGRWLGQIGTRRPTPDLDRMPLGPDRVAAVQAYYDEQYALAYDLIRQAFGPVDEQPGAGRRMGEILSDR